MADFNVHPKHPDVLLVWGKDVYREDFHHILAELPSSPVTLDSHDFWIIHDVEPFKKGDMPNATGHGGHSTPTRLKHFVNLDVNLADTSASGEESYRSQFLHEVGHYWLVPPFRVRIAGKPRPIYGIDTFIHAFFESRDFPSPCVIGKENKHWSCFLSSGQTTFEALPWVWRETISSGSRGDLRRYEVAPPTVIPIVGFDAPYSDLDLYLMGVLGEDEAYPATHGAWSELAPQWMSPIETMAGICIAFAPDDVIQFGFYNGHEKVAVERTGGAADIIDISAFHTPYRMWKSDAHLALRVIRRGQDYHFQVRQEITRIDILTAILGAVLPWLRPPVVDVLGDVDPIAAPSGTPTSLDRWVTVKVIREPRQAIAGGYMVKTWGPTPPLVDMHVSELRIGTSSGNQSVRAVRIPTSAVTDWRARVVLGDFLVQFPKEGPAILLERNLAHIVVGATVPAVVGVKEVGAHDHTKGIDDAPKLLTRLPSGDFVMGGKVALRRTAMAPQAAGAAASRRLWALRRQHNVGDVLPADDARARQADRSPYRCAFLILSPTREKITEAMIAGVDLHRRAAAEWFFVSTKLRRRIETTLF